MRPDTANSVAQYHAAIRLLESASTDLNRLNDPAGAEDAELAEWVAHVEQWRAWNHTQIGQAWQNATTGLARARVPLREPVGYQPPSTPPTAQDLAHALDFTPAMTAIEENLPRTGKFAGFSTMWKAMQRRAIIAAVVAFAIGIADGPSTFLYGAGYANQNSAGAALALLACLGFAWYGWNTDCRPTAHREGWTSTDARYIGAVCLAVLMPTLGGAIAYSLAW